ncbi:MFS transporter [Streptomyces varsoviensis]|uniref:MFS transporter n=1 Tax=Streptomyces varsoviensis TaxID=67373 RepID=UPI0033EEA3E8
MQCGAHGGIGGVIDVRVGESFRRTAAGRSGLRTDPKQRTLLYSVALDTVGTGVFLPLSLLFFLNVQHMSAAAAGTAVTVGSLLSFLVIPPAGRLVQLIGPKRCLMLSNALSVIGYGSYFFASTGLRVIGAAFIVMAADRLYGAAWPSAVARVASKDQLPQWFSFINFLKTTCLGLGAVASTGLLAALGPGGLKLALGANCLSSLAAGALVLRTRVPDGYEGRVGRDSHDERRDARDSPDGPRVGRDGPEGSDRSDGQEKPRPARSRPRSTFGSALRDMPFMALVTSQTMLSVAWLIPTVAFPVYLVHELGLPAYWPAAVVATRYAVIACVQLPLGARLAGWTRGRVLLVAIAVVEAAVLVTLAIPLVPGAAQGFVAAAATALLAVAEAASKPTAAAAAVALAPDRDEGPYMAVFQLTWTVSYAVGPAVIGWGLGNAVGMWCALGACVLVSGAVQALVTRRAPAPAPA